MLEQLRYIQRELDRLKKILPKSQATQVHSKKIKQQTRNLVDYYFREVRAALVNGELTDNELSELDTEMHGLLEHTHRNITSAKYKQNIKRATETTITLEKTCHRKYNSEFTLINTITIVDQKIIQTLGLLLPSAAASYQQALADLQSPNRLSWRGPATDLRESLRETLDHLAPDKDVEQQKGYSREKDTNGPTMRQKVRYVLLKRNVGKTTSSTTENAVSTIEELLGSFVRSVYNRSSISAHTPTDKNEVLRVRDLVRVALCELLEIPG